MARKRNVPRPSDRDQDDFDSDIGQLDDLVIDAEPEKPSKAQPPEWVLGFQSMMALADDGSATSVSRRFDPNLLTIPNLTRRGVFDRVELNLGNGTLELDPGAMIVLGVADSGKTLLSRTLEQRNPRAVQVLRFREPESDSLLYEEELLRQFRLALLGPERFIYIDSLRTVFYAAGGATGKGGVNMGIFELLTAYDLVARATGKVIAFALNPMTNDAQALEFYLEAAKGSVSHTVHATAPKQFRLSTRSSKTRAWADRSYDPGAAAQPQKFSPASVALAVGANADSISDLYNFNTR